MVVTELLLHPEPEQPEPLAPPVLSSFDTQCHQLQSQHQLLD
jgi:hypothetical protein